MKSFCYLIVLLLSSLSKASEFPYLASPVALGAGNIKVFKSDPFSGSYHPGVAAFAPVNSVSLAYQTNYFVEGLNQFRLAGNYKLSKVKSIGITYDFFGNQYYNQSQSKIVLSQLVSSKFGVGVAINYLRIQIPQNDFNVRHSLNVDAAIYYAFSRQLDFAFHVISPASNRNSNRLLPCLLSTHLIYNSGSNLTCIAEFNQILGGYHNLNVGMEYNFSKNFVLRAGLQTKQLSPSFGISATNKRYCIHLAFSFHPYLSSTSALGFTYLPK
jgi:hypothetical protein